MYKNMIVIAVLNQITSIINKMNGEQWLLLLTNICIYLQKVINIQKSLLFWSGSHLHQAQTHAAFLHSFLTTAQSWWAAIEMTGISPEYEGVSRVSDAAVKILL